MKSLLTPLASALLAATLCVLGCHAFGMRHSDLYIAAFVSGSVSISAALLASFLSKARQKSN